jgi:hypothetical protein
MKVDDVVVRQSPVDPGYILACFVEYGSREDSIIHAD